MEKTINKYLAQPWALKPLPPMQTTSWETLRTPMYTPTRYNLTLGFNSLTTSLSFGLKADQVWRPLSYIETVAMIPSNSQPKSLMTRLIFWILL